MKKNEFFAMLGVMGTVGFVMSITMSIIYMVKQW